MGYMELHYFIHGTLQISGSVVSPGTKPSRHLGTTVLHCPVHSSTLPSLTGCSRCQPLAGKKRMRRSTYARPPEGQAARSHLTQPRACRSSWTAPPCPPHPTAQDVLLSTQKVGKCRPPGTHPLHLAVWPQSPYSHSLPSHQSLSALSRLTLQIPSKGGLGANAP